MRSSPLQTPLRVALVLLAACFAVAVARAQDVTHVVSGTVEKVDAGAKIIAVKTADGTVETVKFTEKTAVHGLKDAAKGADLAGKEGTSSSTRPAKARPRPPIPSSGSATKRSIRPRALSTMSARARRRSP